MNAWLARLATGDWRLATVDLRPVVTHPLWVVRPRSSPDSTHRRLRGGAEGPLLADRRSSRTCWERASLAGISHARCQRMPALSKPSASHRALTFGTSLVASPPKEPVSV